MTLRFIYVQWGSVVQFWQGHVKVVELTMD